MSSENEKESEKYNAHYISEVIPCQNFMQLILNLRRNYSVTALIFNLINAVQFLR